MPKKLIRLRKRKDFLRISAKKCSKPTTGFVIQVDVNPELKKFISCNDAKPAPRVGFTVSKKVGNAVKRNFVKRRLRALADSLIRDYEFFGIDYVIIGRKAAIDMSFDVMHKDFQKALKVVIKKLK